MSPLGGIRIFYSSSILWNSDLSSIRVKWFANSNIRFSWSHPSGDLYYAFLELRARICFTLFTDRRILLSRAPCVVTGKSLALEIFPNVDVAFAMSRCCIPPSRACVPPSMSRMILLSELIQTTCNWLYTCIGMSLMTTTLYILRLCSLFKLHHEWLHTLAPPLAKNTICFF